MHSDKYIRKLEEKEKLVNTRLSSRNFLLSFRLKSKFDLFADLDFIKQPIQEWKKLHQFLQSKVVRQTESDHYFALNESSSANVNLENVHFLRLHSFDGREDAYDDIYKLLNEKLCTDVIDSNTSELLWRLFIIELNFRKNEFEYEMFLQYHHSIADAVSGYYNFKQLLNVISLMRENKTNRINLKEFSLFPGIETFYKDQIDIPYEEIDFPHICVPSFIDSTRAKQCSFQPLKYLSQSDIDNVTLVDVQSNDKFLSLSEIIDESKRNSYRIKRFITEKDTTQKLANKCRMFNVKMTTCLNMISCFALRKLYEKYGSSLNEVVYYTSINLRQFKQNDISNDILGYSAGGIRSVSKLDDDQGKDEDTFWNKVTESYKLFSERVNNTSEKFGFGAKKSTTKPPTITPNSLFIHFINSNIGILESDLGNGLFKLENSFVSGSLSRDANYLILIVRVTTVQDKICWLVSNNSYFVDNIFIDEFIKNCQQLILEVI